jgi:hypothetical protein
MSPSASKPLRVNMFLFDSPRSRIEQRRTAQRRTVRVAQEKGDPRSRIERRRTAQRRTVRVAQEKGDASTIGFILEQLACRGLKYQQQYLQGLRLLVWGERRKIAKRGRDVNGVGVVQKGVGYADEPHAPPARAHGHNQFTQSVKGPGQNPERNTLPKHESLKAAT